MLYIINYPNYHGSFVIYTEDKLVQFMLKFLKNNGNFEALYEDPKVIEMKKKLIGITKNDVIELYGMSNDFFIYEISEANINKKSGQMQPIDINKLANLIFVNPTYQLLLGHRFKSGTHKDLPVEVIRELHKMLPEHLHEYKPEPKIIRRRV
jgi:hypothetical protein